MGKLRCSGEGADDRLGRVKPWRPKEGSDAGWPLGLLSAENGGKSGYGWCSAVVSWTALRPICAVREERGLLRPEDEDNGIGLDGDERPFGGDILGNLNWLCGSVIKGGGRERERLAGRQSIGTRERDLLIALQSIGTSLYCDIIHLENEF